MSFSSEQKNEIIEQMPRMRCCRFAFLQGVFAARARLEGGAVTLSLDSYKSATAISDMINELYGKTPEVAADKSGGRRVNVTFVLNSLHKKLSAFSSFSHFFERKCSACESSFIRGVFFSSGKMTAPARGYRLEISVPERVDELCEFLFEIGLNPKTREKAGQKVVYFRKSSDIEDFLASAAMNNAMFALMNEKIKSEIRNGVNRVVNCETNNLSRAGAASGRSVELIKYLVENDLMSRLPEELENTARLRLENPDFSLMRLAALHTPPISKPGLSHRLKKIEMIAEEAAKKNKT